MSTGIEIGNLAGMNFAFNITKLPNVMLDLQSFEFPTVSLGEQYASTPHLDYTIAGQKLSVDRISMDFIVDANMDNYDEILYWLWEITNPITGEGIVLASDAVSDGLLSIYGPHGTVVKEYRFVDIFPTQVSGLQFNTTMSESGTMTATLTMACSYYVIEGVKDMIKQ